MRKILFAILLCLPLWAVAQDTPTPTPTKTNTPDPRRSGDAIRVLYKEMTTVLPTAVPTAFITPAHVINSSTGVKFQKISVINESDCAVVVSYDGITAIDIVPAKTAWEDNLARDKRYHQGAIYIRGQAACTAGNVYITGRY